MVLKEGLTGHLLIYQGEKYMFNYREAVLSVLPICDEFVICECFSDDGTYEGCLDLQRQYPEIRIIRHPWQDGTEEPGYEYRRLARLTNACIEDARTKWAIQIQADEAVHEDGHEEVLRIIQGRSRFGDSPRAIASPFVHLVGNTKTQFRFVYQSSVRIARVDSTWRAFKDAWTLQHHDPGDGFVVHAVQARYFHYGFAFGLSMERMAKEKHFQSLFASEGFPDKKVLEMADGDKPLSMAYLFQAAKERGEFTPFTGTHPAVMKDWIESHRQYEEIFE